MTPQEALVLGIARLCPVLGAEAARRDARRLLAHVLQTEAGKLAFCEAPLKSHEIDKFEEILKARLARKPVAQLVDQREFWGRSFIVTPDVLDPRPDTETLVEAALKLPFKSVLDLGTGSGCILATMLAERPGATGVGVDLSPAALRVAARNLSAYAPGRHTLLEGNWFEPVQGRFDLILSNPPYVSDEEYAALAPELTHEPRMALTPGGDGLDSYRVIAAGSAEYLAPDGRVLVEFGSTQASAVCAIFEAAGYSTNEVIRDLSGHDRTALFRQKATHAGETA